MLVQTRFECRRSVVWVRRAVAKATGCDGVNVWQNNGPAARQEVFHGPTVHVFPRHHDDDISSMMASRQALPDAEAEQMAAKIRAALEEDEEQLLLLHLLPWIFHRVVDLELQELEASCVCESK